MMKKIKVNMMAKVMAFVIFMMLGGIGITEIKAASNPYPNRQDVNGNGYYEIPCTWFVWQHVYDNLGIALPSGWGNGGEWLNNAKNSGYTAGNTAKANSIAVWQDNGRGHVAFVSAVDGNNMYIAEGGRKDLDQTSSHGVAYNFKLSSSVGSYRSDGTQRLVGFIYLDQNSQGVDPKGYADSIEGGKGSIAVSGWAFDKDAPNQNLRIDVYIGGKPGEQGIEIHKLTADKLRTDVDRVFGVGNYHGFKDVIRTTKIGSQTVYLYAINVGSGQNILIGSKTVTISLGHNPYGYVDSIEGGKGKVSVSGWAFDGDAINRRLKVYMYIGGGADTRGAKRYKLTANKLRTDVDKVFGVGNYHGFKNTVSTTKTGKQDVYLYAINVGSGKNVLLGKWTVTIN